MTIVEPKVSLLAHTMINRDAIAEHMEIQGGSTDAETLTVFAGRSCYQSFHRSSPATFHDPDYLERTLYTQGHWSIAEHATATLYFTGVSRAFTHELIRHRHLSYSQLSQRFVDEGDANFVIPPAANKSKKEVVYRAEGAADDLEGHLPNALTWWGYEALWAYEIMVGALTDEGLPRKQAREAARAVLPNMAETKIVVTGNLRAWHEVIQRRTQPDADAEMQHVMGMARDTLATIAPSIFGYTPDELHDEDAA